MSKKNLLTIVLIAVFVVGIIFGIYKIFEPKKVDVVANDTISEPVFDYDSLKQYTISTGESSTHYYFFCSDSDNNCVYTKDSLMKPLAKSANIQEFTAIEYIDITDLIDNLETNKLQDDWNISNYPAFVSVTVRNGNIVINNSLIWDDENPFTQTDLKQWMIDNQIWEGTIDEQEEAIAVPQQ